MKLDIEIYRVPSWKYYGVLCQYVLKTCGVDLLSWSKTPLFEPEKPRLSLSNSVKIIH